ncbi:hypothetical protein MPER_10158 [Moniliophthora perniciosa FA553]|nr:hypothetical protein MPER_10158 [Moniliophthora perniciosa FA553]
MLTPTPPLASRQHISDPNIDPALYTPGSRLRTLYSNLGSTSSSSILLSQTKITSATPILNPVIEKTPSDLPEPDWNLINPPTHPPRTITEYEREVTRLRASLRSAKLQVDARDMIIEGAHASMTYQNMHLQKLNSALNMKEKKKKGDRLGGTRLTSVAGGALVITSDEFFEEQRRLQAERDEKEKQRRERADARAAVKEAKQRVATEWEDMKQRHEKALKAWEVERELLKAQKVPKKDWPKKPARPKKPKVTMTADDLSDSLDFNEPE